MTPLARRPLLRWMLRFAFLLTACEGTLAFAACVLERFGGHQDPVGAAAGIVCIGDSNTFGIGAPAGRSYPDQLAELLRAVGDPRLVTNLGVPGFNTRRIIDRLEQALPTMQPEWVCFLGGINDHGRLDLASTTAVTPPPLSVRIVKALDRLRTVRVAKAGWHVARGDLVHEEIGGADATRLPTAASVPYDQWDAAYARARAAGGSAYCEWLLLFWQRLLPDRMRRAFDDLKSVPGAAEICSTLRYSPDVIEWDLRWVEGLEGRPLPSRPTSAHDKAYAAWIDLANRIAAGRFDEVRPLLAAARPINDDPWGRAFLEMSRAWLTFLMRDWSGARKELAASLASSLALSPSVAIKAQLGAFAIAHLLAGGPEVRLAEILEVHGEVWKQQTMWDDHPFDREWMVAAELIDAVKGGLRPDEYERVLAGARRRVPKPVTRPLRWLLDHRNATVDEIRAGLELEPCRSSWLGVLQPFFEGPGQKEFAAITAVDHDRLERLAKEHGFRVLVLTYLVQDWPCPNERLREVAKEKGYRLADVHTTMSLPELYADDRKTWFSADRSHPNEAGYGLMAHAAFEAIRSQP